MKNFTAAMLSFYESVVSNSSQPKTVKKSEAEPIRNYRANLLKGISTRNFLWGFYGIFLGLLTASGRRISSLCVGLNSLGKYRSYLDLVTGSRVYLNGGRTPTGRAAIEWALEAERRGAGEILLTSMDTDGARTGFDLKITREITAALSIPVIASGGAGEMRHFAEAFDAGARAALAASLFHFNELKIPELKDYLAGRGYPMRREIQETV